MDVGIRTFLRSAVLLCVLAGGMCNQPFTPELIATGIISVTNDVISDALYKILRKEEGNLAFSPLSAQAMLTMAWLGANGTTARQLEEKAGLIPESEEFLILGYRNLIRTLESHPTITVDLANKLYLQQDFRLNATFQRAMTEGFQSEVQLVDFANNVDGARDSINNWVENKTHGRIKDMVNEGILCEHTLLVAVNALYFRGGWLLPFDEQLTTTEPFHVTSTSTVNVPMMHQKEHFVYGHQNVVGFQAILMKYRGYQDDPAGQDQTTSMLILLPDAIDGLPQVEAFVTGGYLNTFMEAMYIREVNVSLPRFKIESSLKLVPALNKLGITELFKPNADLSRMTDQNLYISKVVQKAVVEVSEKGTEAAASTYMEAVPMANFVPPVFKADHPFMFIIMNHIHRLKLFMGRVVQP